MTLPTIVNLLRLNASKLRLVPGNPAIQVRPYINRQRFDSTSKRLKVFPKLLLEPGIYSQKTAENFAEREAFYRDRKEQVIAKLAMDKAKIKAAEKEKMELSKLERDESNRVKMQRRIYDKEKNPYHLANQSSD